MQSTNWEGGARNAVARGQRARPAGRPDGGTKCDASAASLSSCKAQKREGASCRCAPRLRAALTVSQYSTYAGAFARRDSPTARLMASRICSGVASAPTSMVGAVGETDARPPSAHVTLMLIGVKMSRVKNATNWLTKLSCVSIFAAPCEHCEAVATVLGGTSPKIQPAANDFSTTWAEGFRPVSTVAW